MHVRHKKITRKKEKYTDKSNRSRVRIKKYKVLSFKGLSFILIHINELKSREKKGPGKCCS